jgi:cytochrome c biogenesis protein CcdA/glutaredoxin
LYFYANDCPHCIEVIEEVLLPLKEKHGDLLDLRLLEISIPEYYEAMLKIEAYFDVPSEERSIPTLIIDSEILIGETPIRESFGQMVADGIEQGGIAFPKIENVDMGTLVSVDPDTALETDPLCAEDEVCSVEAPIYAAYFYQTGCKECSRVEADLTYLRSQYPQLQVVDFNIYEHADLAAWMTEQIGFEEEFVTPALIIGEQVVLNDQLSLENITEVIEDYRQTGTDPIWTDYDPDQGQQTVLERFRNMGWFAVVAAGLIDGINPCAFATLIFFVSYLTLSRRTGKEVLFVGGAFTMGVFIAYLAVGLGLYQILELVSGTLDVIAKVVYVLTGVFCLVLAVLSFLDYQKARQGEVSDMLLKLPAPLRKRINATIRKGRSSTNYIIGAFVAGILISFLELACTGQVYLPTIIFVSSIPELRLRAILYLIIYNLLFILPLVVIFILVYFGTTSKDLTQFLQKNASWVKLGMSIVFVALGVWLFVSMLF